MPLFVIMITVALAISGGVSIAAESAAPGDALYSVKTNINDEVRAAAHTVADVLVGSEADVTADAKTEASAQTNVNADVNANVDADLEAQLNSKTDASLLVH